MGTTSREIDVRDIDFELERGAGGLWNPQQPEVSHTLNAFQLALPYLEPYFVDAIRAGAAQMAARIDDPALRADAKAFCAQESNHSRQHGRYNRLLRKRYPRLEEYEKQIRRSLIQRRRTEPLASRLAFTAACEAITAELSRLLFRNADAWFRGADGHFAALMLWHAAEEIEHKSVAFDVLRATGVGHGLRVKGLVSAVRQMLLDLDPIASYMLSVDGVRGFASARRRFAFRAAFLGAVAPRLFRYALPGYDPSSEPDPDLARAWMDAYAGGQRLASIDTNEALQRLAPACR
jgi:predicted metal-dependent hydrolase